jgi:hypothetical protein
MTSMSNNSNLQILQKKNYPNFTENRKNNIQNVFK